MHRFMNSSRGSLGWLLSLLIVLCFLAACAPTQESAESPQETPPVFDLAAARLVDLTYPFDGSTIYWPNSPVDFELTQLSRGITEAGFFYAANTFSTAEHGGTHLDAPIHFAEGKWTADEIPVERLLAPAVVIDVSEKAALDPDYRLIPEDVALWEKTHGEIPPGAVVLLRTGWGSHWPDRKAYLGDDRPGETSDLHFPSYGEEAAGFLVEERRIGLLGVDTASIDHGPSTDFIVHRIAHEANVPGLENVANLELMPETGAWVMALPMKIADGSGGPVRIVGLIWD